MTNLSDIHCRILWLGIEGETGLWEIAWDLKNIGTTLNVDETRAHLTDLVRDGYLQILVEMAPGGPTAALGSGDVSTALADDNRYGEPSVGAHATRFVTTDAGEAIYWERCESAGKQHR